ncbi:MAG: archease [Candidatus Omnitrophota bacterium]|nr:MAG: archease [Candidatus Omnitrophota bacterium]
MEDFEFIEHTADFGIRVYGKTLPELFVNSAQALFSIILDYKPQAEIQKTIELEEENLEDLFVDWMNELISQFFADKFLPAQYSVSIESKPELNILKADITGEGFNPYERKINKEIKAATYHNLKVEKTKEGYAAEVIFDV